MLMLNALPTLRPGHDRIQRPALFGVQFRDAASRRVVADGLRVEMADLWQPRRSQALQANRSGVFALHRFAGLPGFGDDITDSPVAADRFQLRVFDALRRYLPMRTMVTLPQAGLFDIPGAEMSPADAAPHVPLFSAATRAAPPDQSVLRAELRQADDPDEPAAWARLELWLGAERLGQGMADEAGRALLVFPQPRPRAVLLRTSPSVPPQPEPWTWDVELRVFWQPAPALSPDLPDQPGRLDVPDLLDLLTQPEAALLQGLSPRAPLQALVLRAGQPLLATGTRGAFLYVAP